MEIILIEANISIKLRFFTLIGKERTKKHDLIAK